MTAESADVSSIQDVVDELGAIVDRSRREGSRLGYFAALYHTVTQSVQHGIEAGYFDDAARMERFDVAFAKRYLDALAAYRAEGAGTGGDAGGQAAGGGQGGGGLADSDVPRSWRVAFDTVSRWEPVVMQHLVLGMNAHINLDLGIATASTAPGDQLPSLRRDYDRINEILVSIFEDVQRQIYEVSPWMGLLDKLGGRYDDVVARFSIEKARAQAWDFARELAQLDPADWAAPIKQRDGDVAGLARMLARPGWLRLLLLPIRLRESDDTSKTCEVLSRAQPLSFDELEARVQSRPGS